MKKGVCLPNLVSTLGYAWLGKHSREPQQALVSVGENKYSMTPFGANFSSVITWTALPLLGTHLPTQYPGLRDTYLWPTSAASDPPPKQGGPAQPGRKAGRQ